MKKGFGNTTAGLFSSYKYMESPYDNQRDLDKKEKMNHKAKIYLTQAQIVGKQKRLWLSLRYGGKTGGGCTM